MIDYDSFSRCHIFFRLSRGSKRVNTTGPSRLKTTCQHNIQKRFCRPMIKLRRNYVAATSKKSCHERNYVAATSKTSCHEHFLELKVGRRGKRIRLPENTARYVLRSAHFNNRFSGGNTNPREGNS